MLWRWLPLGLSLGWPEKLREMNCYWPHRRVTGARNIYVWTLSHIGAGKPYESYIFRTARWHKCGCIFWGGGCRLRYSQPQCRRSLGVESEKRAEQIGEVPLRYIGAKLAEACTELARLGTGWWERRGRRILTWRQRGHRTALVPISPAGPGRLHDPRRGYIYARKVLMPTHLKCFLSFLSLHYVFDR